LVCHLKVVRVLCCPILVGEVAVIKYGLPVVLPEPWLLKVTIIAGYPHDHLRSIEHCLSLVPSCHYFFESADNLLKRVIADPALYQSTIQEHLEGNNSSTLIEDTREPINHLVRGCLNFLQGWQKILRHRLNRIRCECCKIEKSNPCCETFI